VIKRLTRDEVKAKTKALGLSPERAELLFGFIQGHIEVDFWRGREIEEFVLKRLEPVAYRLLPREDYPHASNSLYEYDPPKNGQNIIKHGLDFGEVVSFSRKFGTLMIPCPDDTDRERRLIFSDLDLTPGVNQLTLPPSSIQLNAVNFTFSIVQQRGDKFRFISSRILSTEKRKCRRNIEDVVKGFFTEADQKDAFVDRSMEILEENLIDSWREEPLVR